MLSQEQIDEIIDKTDIVELVSQFVSLEKAGKGYKGLCPFHNDSSPSFMIEPTKKIAKCMSCGEGGNPINFLKKIKNIPFEEAAYELASKAGVKVNISFKKNAGPDYSKYYQITDISQKFYSRNLLSTKSGQVAIDYLHKRGINDETIKMFGIGLSSANSDVLYNVLKESKILELDMIDLGLVKAKENSYYDMFTRRIIFPIYDEFSHVLGFSGRLYLENEDKNQPKYVNSPETVIFKKGLVLFNLNNAINDIRRTKRVILYEGFMDVIASFRSGLKESVCSMGTALTINQANLIRKYAKEVIICYDGDNAGVNASVKAIKILKQANLDVKMVMLPNDIDPDEYVSKYGEEAYKNYFEENIIDPTEYLYLNAIRNKDLTKFSDIEVAKKMVFDAIGENNSQTLIENYLNRFSNEAKVSYSSLIIDYDNYSNKHHISKNVENDFELQINNNFLKEGLNYLTKYSVAELRLFVYAMQNKEKANYIDSNIDLSTFEEMHSTLWMQLIDNYYSIFDEFDEKKFIAILNSKNENYLNCYKNDKHTIAKMVKIKYCNEDLEECIKIFNEYTKKKKINDINDKFRDKNYDEQIRLLEEKIKVMKEINKNQLQKKRK